jgi:hypothetical protein
MISCPLDYPSRTYATLLYLGAITGELPLQNPINGRFA